SFSRDWSSDVCSSDLNDVPGGEGSAYQRHAPQPAVVVEQDAVALREVVVAEVRNAPYSDFKVPVQPRARPGDQVRIRPGLARECGSVGQEDILPVRVEPVDRGVQHTLAEPGQRLRGRKGHGDKTSGGEGGANKVSRRWLSREWTE